MQYKAKGQIVREDAFVYPAHAKEIRRPMPPHLMNADSLYTYPRLTGVYGYK